MLHTLDDKFLQRKDDMDTIDKSTANILRQFIERIERLEEDKTTITQDIREVFAEAKSQGFDSRTMKEVIKLRKLDNQERNEQEELLNTYLGALEMTESSSESMKVAA